MRSRTPSLVVCALLWACGSSGDAGGSSGAGLDASAFDGASDAGASEPAEGGAAPDGSASGDASASPDGATFPTTDGGPGTVAGRVVDEEGEGMPNLPVVVGGHMTTTDATGHFSMASLTPPYELIVSYPPRRRVQIYEGLTRLDPVITLPWGSADYAATPSVTLAGNFAASNGTTLMVASSSALGFADIAATPAATPYTYNAAWSGPSHGTAEIAALQLTQTNGVATAFSGFGSASFTASDGQSPSVSLPLSPVTTSTIAGTVTAPSDYTINAYAVGFYDKANLLAPSGINFTNVQGTAKGSDTFSFLAPDVGPGYGVRLFVGATGWAPKMSSLLTTTLTIEDPAASTTVTLPAAARPTAPEPQTSDGGFPHRTLVTMATPFTWTAVPNAAYEVDFGIQGDSTDYLAVEGSPVVIYTNATTLTLPDLTSLGMTWTSGTVYEWEVLTIGPGNVDTFAAFPKHVLASTLSSAWSFGVQ